MAGCVLCPFIPLGALVALGTVGVGKMDVCGEEVFGDGGSASLCTSLDKASFCRQIVACGRRQPALSCPME